MSFVARIPRSVAASKPAHGAPCNNCGACCWAVPCNMARHLFGATSGRCPALRPGGCGLVEASSGAYRAAVLLLIGSGEGCDARFNGEAVDHAFHAFQQARDREQAAAIGAARLLLGLPQWDDDNAM